MSVWVVSVKLCKFLPGMRESRPQPFAARIPHGVICLISALAFHGFATQIPHQVDIAVPRSTKPPRLQFPPIRVFRFSKPMQDAGVEERRVGQIEVPVYGAAKTVTDSFRFRYRLGIDAAVEMLRLFHARKKNTRAGTPRLLRARGRSRLGVSPDHLSGRGLKRSVAMFSLTCSQVSPAHMDSQSSHSEPRDRKPRQAFTICVCDPHCMHFSRTDPVVAEHCRRHGGVHQNIDLRDSPAAVLCVWDNAPWTRSRLACRS